MSLYSSRAPSYVKSTQKSVSASPHVVPGYNPDVPQSFSSPAASQPTLLANAQTYDAVYGVDHSGYGSTTNVGFHNFVTAILQGSAPTADATNGRLVSLTDSDGHAQLYWQQPGNGYLFQLTSYLSSGNGSTTDGSGMSVYQVTSTSTPAILTATLFYGSWGTLQYRLILSVINTTVSGTIVWGIPFKDVSGNTLVFPNAPLFGWGSAGGAGAMVGVSRVNTTMPTPTPGSRLLYTDGLGLAAVTTGTQTVYFCMGY